MKICVKEFRCPICGKTIQVSLDEDLFNRISADGSIVTEKDFLMEIFHVTGTEHLFRVYDES